MTIAQTLYFTHFKLNAPSGLYHTISSTGFIFNDKNYQVNFSRGDYVDNSPRWEQMALNRQQPNTEYVANLMADVGYRVGMKYAAAGSGANISQSAMQSYGLTYDEKDYHYNDVISQIRKGMPVMITAYANTYTTGWWFWKQTHYSDGHAWVIDGIVDNTRNIKYDYIWERVFVPDNPSGPHEEQIMPIYDISDLYSQYEEVLTLDEANLRGIFPGDRETRTDTYTTTNILMNWGWNGSYDGQYSPYASSWTGGGYNFQYTRKIYYNIRKI